MPGRLLCRRGAVTDIDSLCTGMQQRNALLARAAGKTTDVLEIMRYPKLLAVNAGIEAARAGAAGQTFSVLAHQMHDPACRSEEMTKSLSAA